MLPRWPDERGIVVLDDAAGAGAAGPASAEVAAVRGALSRFGGGLLADAVRADTGAMASRLVARCAWVPALEDALEIAGKLPPGWSVATRSGAVVTAAGTVRLGIADAPLERRAEVEAVRRQVELAEAERVDADGHLARAHARGRGGPGRGCAGTARGGGRRIAGQVNGGGRATGGARRRAGGPGGRLACLARGDPRRRAGGPRRSPGCAPGRRRRRRRPRPRPKRPRPRPRPGGEPADWGSPGGLGGAGGRPARPARPAGCRTGGT